MARQITCDCCKKAIAKEHRVRLDPPLGPIGARFAGRTSLAACSKCLPKLYKMIEAWLGKPLPS